MLSSGGTEPDTWTWTPSDGSTTSGEVPALPIPSPLDGSGRSRSNGAGRHRDQPPLVRNRTRIFGARTPSRHVKPTIVTSAVSRAGVCQRSVPVLASPRSLSCFSRIPTPEVGVRLEQQPAVAAAVLGVEGAQDPGAGPRDDPGAENGHGGGTQHLSASGTRRARVVVRSHFSLTRHTSDHIASADHSCTRRARPSAKRSRGVSCRRTFLIWLPTPSAKRPRRTTCSAAGSRTTTSSRPPRTASRRSRPRTPRRRRRPRVLRAGCRRPQSRPRRSSGTR